MLFLSMKQIISYPLAVSTCLFITIPAGCIRSAIRISIDIHNFKQFAYTFFQNMFWQLITSCFDIHVGYLLDRGPVVKRVRPPREFSRPIYFVLGTSKEYKTTCYIHNKCSLHCFIAILPLFYNKKYIFCKFCFKSFNHSLKCVKKVSFSVYLDVI